MKNKYYQFSYRGFANEYILVKFDNKETFDKVSQEFYDIYPNAKIWNIRYKNLTQKEREQARYNDWQFDGNN
jgi:hypothetical protein